MDHLSLYCNQAASPERSKRKDALGRIAALLADAEESPRLQPDHFTAITRTALRALEDKMEKCRELAADIVMAVTPRQTPDVLDWVLPAVVSRIGLEPVAEQSEELRLRLLEVAVLCLETYPTDVGARYIDYYKVLLENCIADPYPDLKKAALRACVALCRAEPKRVKGLTLPLAKVVKRQALQHKHGAVRAEAVTAFATLVAHGAAEILGDMKDEQDNRTTVHYLYILCHDHSEIVRMAAVDALSCFLLDITERNEQPRRLLPHVLGLLSDPLEEVRIKANSLLLGLGRQFMLDNEDNRIDMEKRRVTLKDIEWYGDDEQPDMATVTRSTQSMPDFSMRPALGSRHVVAEHMRTFVDALLADIGAVNWMIPFSNVNRRVVALRTLAVCIWLSERNVVQYVQQILGTMYKALRDDDREIATEAALCVELLGKYLAPAQYVPFILARPKAGATEPGHVDPSAEETGDRQVTATRTKVVTVVSAGQDLANQPPPTLFSTAAGTTKAGILVAFRLLLLGTAHGKLGVGEAKAVVQAVTHADLQDPDSPPLLRAVLDCYVTVATLLRRHGYVATAGQPLPPDTVRTLDSMLVYGALCMLQCPDPEVHAKVEWAVAEMSTAIRGDPASLYTVNFGRIMTAHKGAIPAEAFVTLVDRTPDLTAHSQLLTDLFVARLAGVNYTLRVQSEVSIFTMLRRLLAGTAVAFTSSQLELLLRQVVLVHAKFSTTPAALLFRKLALACLGLMLAPPHVTVLREALVAENAGLAERAAGMWLGGADSDDAEMRLSCMDRLVDVALLPVSPGAAAEFVDHVMARFDDSSDRIRALTFERLHALLTTNAEVSPCIVVEVNSKLAVLVKRLLVHMDDTADTLGIRDTICRTLKRLCGMNAAVVQQLTQQVRDKHATPRYCDEVLAFVPN